MGQSVSTILVRAAGLLMAGLLLFSLFGHAQAQSRSDNYGLSRYPGDNYDTLPPGAAIAPAPSAQQGYGPVPQGYGPQNYAPMSGVTVAPNGTYSRLNGGNAMPQNYPGEQPPAYAGYQIVPQQPMPPLQQQAQSFSPPAANDASGGAYRAPQQMPQQAPQPQQDTYGYRPLPSAPQQQSQVQQPQQPQQPTQPYRQAPPMPASVRMANTAPAAVYQGGYTMGGYVLGPGDKLKLTVYGETDLSGEFTVDGSGYARLPMIGQVRAAGYTAQQMEQMVASTLSQGYLKTPRVSVEISTYRPFYVIGAVNRPGQYPYVEHMNAMNAIALAGGFTPTAVESVVFLRRENNNKEEEVPVDRTTIIYPGDVITVHNTLFSELTNWLSPFSGVAAAAATAAVFQ